MDPQKSQLQQCQQPTDTEIGQLLDAVKNQVGTKAYWILKRLVYQLDLVAIEREEYILKIQSLSDQVKGYEADITSYYNRQKELELRQHELEAIVQRLGGKL